MDVLDLILTRHFGAREVDELTKGGNTVMLMFDPSATTDINCHVNYDKPSFAA